MNLQEILEREAKFIYNLPLPGVNKMKLALSLYRSLTWDSQIYSLLHGSTVISAKGNAILFGDGVDCIGKTTTSLMIAFTSGKFVIDEFSLYNQATGNIYGNKELRIFIRDTSLKFLENKREMIDKKQIELGYGGHILPSDFNFEVVTMVKLVAIICPHPYQGKSLLKKEENYSVKIRKLAILANAHRLKWIESNLDRVDGKTDKRKKIELIDYTPGYKIPDGLLEIPYYDAYLGQPKDIIGLLKKEGL